MPSTEFCAALCPYIAGYLGIISLVAIILTVTDKYKARHHRWRIPEAALFWVAALGGCAAMYVTMRLIHHKTRHRRFMWGLPAILLLQIAVAAYLFSRLG